MTYYSAQGIVFETIFGVMGIIALTYSHYFWYSESNLDGKIKNTKYLLICLCSAMIGYDVLKQLSIDQGHWLYTTLYFYLQFISIYFVGSFLIKVKTSADQSYTLKNAIIIASIVSCILPFVFFVFESFMLQYLILNLGVFCVIIAYVIGYIKQGQLEMLENTDQIEKIAFYQEESKQKTLEVEEKTRVISLLSERLEELECQENNETRIIEFLLEHDSLTSSESEIAKMLGIGLSFREISFKKNIASSTARKHAANIYSKLDVKNLDEFRKLFKR